MQTSLSDRRRVLLKCISLPIAILLLIIYVASFDAALVPDVTIQARAIAACKCCLHHLCVCVHIVFLFSPVNGSAAAQVIGALVLVLSCCGSGQSMSGSLLVSVSIMFSFSNLILGLE